jgi:rubrerythrin
MTEPAEPQEPQKPQEPGEPQEAPRERPEEEEEEDGQGKPSEPGEGEPEDESGQQPEGLSEKEIEARFDKLRKEQERHAKRVGEILEEDAQQLLVCELCWPLAPGFRWPLIEEEQRSAVLTAVGISPEPDLRQDKHSTVCPDCDGYGKVATGSKVEGHKSETCMACNAFGWVGPRKTMKSEVAAPAAPPAVVNGPHPEAPLDPDREAARQAAQAAGFMVIDTRAPAAP